MEEIIPLLERIAIALERMAPRESAPNLVYDMTEWKSYDWSALGATVLVRDKDGPAIVEWGGNRYTRRSPNNGWGAAVFYSRCIGTDETGKKLYDRLIAFKELPKNAKPISREAEAYIN